MLNQRFEVINPIWFNVIAGDIFFNPPQARRVTRRVSRIFVHSEYSAFTGDANIAILRVNFKEKYWKFFNCFNLVD